MVVMPSGREMLVKAVPQKASSSMVVTVHFLPLMSTLGATLIWGFVAASSA